MATACPAGAAPFRTGQIRLSKEVTTFKELREKEVVLQQWDFTCGAAALATILEYQYGRDYSEDLIVGTLLNATGKEFKTILKDGFSLLDLKVFAVAAGFNADGYAQLTVDELSQFGVPAIVPVYLFDFHHFVVFREAHANRVFLADPAVGNTVLTRDEFEAAWQDGIGFFILDPEAEKPENRLSVEDRELLFARKRQTIDNLSRATINFTRRSTAQRVITAITPRPQRPRFGSLPFDGLEFLGLPQQ